MNDPPNPGSAVTGGQFVRGAVFVGASSWLGYALNFAIAIAVARIIGPEALGLYALAVAINEFVDIVNGFAIAPALVQAREESTTLYDTGYAMSLAQGLLGLLMAILLAPVVWSFRSPEVAWFVLILGVVRIFNLLTDAMYAALDRHRQYGPIAVMTLATRSAPNLAALGLAWLGLGPWSLILRDLLMGSSAFGLVRWWSGYRFRRRVSREAFRRIWSFSGPMFVARTLDVFLLRFDRLMVGSALGNLTMGLYHQARFLAEAGLLVTTPIMRVTFNLYARLQDDVERLANSFGVVNYFLSRLLLAGSAVLIVYPAETLRLLLGSEWVAAAPLLRILGIYGALVPILENTKWLLYARGEVGANVRLRLFQLVVLVPGVSLSVWRGSAAGVAASLLAATAAGVVLAFVFSGAPVRKVGLRSSAVPLAALCVTAAVLGLLLPEPPLPWWARPLLPPTLFAILVAALDRGRLLRELRSLQRQFVAARADRPAA